MYRLTGSLGTCASPCKYLNFYSLTQPVGLFSHYRLVLGVGGAGSSWCLQAYDGRYRMVLLHSIPNS